MSNFVVWCLSYVFMHLYFGEMHDTQPTVAAVILLGLALIVALIFDIKHLEG